MKWNRQEAINDLKSSSYLWQEIEGEKQMKLPIDLLDTYHKQIDMLLTINTFAYSRITDTGSFIDQLSTGAPLRLSCLNRHLYLLEALYRFCTYHY